MPSCLYLQYASATFSVMINANFENPHSFAYCLRRQRNKRFFLTSTSFLYSTNLRLCLHSSRTLQGCMQSWQRWHTKLLPSKSLTTCGGLKKVWFLNSLVREESFQTQTPWKIEGIIHTFGTKRCYANIVQSRQAVYNKQVNVVRKLIFLRTLRKRLCFDGKFWNSLSVHLDFILYFNLI